MIPDRTVCAAPAWSHGLRPCGHTGAQQLLDPLGGMAMHRIRFHVGSDRRRDNTVARTHKLNSSSYSSVVCMLGRRRAMNAGRDGDPEFQTSEARPGHWASAPARRPRLHVPAQYNAGVRRPGRWLAVRPPPCAYRTESMHAWVLRYVPALWASWLRRRLGSAIAASPVRHRVQCRVRCSVLLLRLHVLARPNPCVVADRSNKRLLHGVDGSPTSIYR